MATRQAHQHANGPSRTALAAALLSVAALSSTSLPADGAASSTYLPPLAFEYATPKLSFTYLPSVRAGTHINAAGVDLAFRRPIDLKRLNGRSHALVPHARVGANAYYQNLGIPGISLSAEAQVGLGYTFGRPLHQAAVSHLFAGLYRHSISYSFVRYQATDSTSQYSGLIHYRRTGRKGIFDFMFENDFLGLQHRDEYRTCALELSYRHRVRGRLVGLGVNLTLWTGTTDGLGLLSRNEVYDMSGQYGGEYSHGLLCVKFMLDAFELAVGVDSERVRDVAQNGLHQVIDDGAIEPLPGREPRLYVQFSVSDFGTLY